MPGIGESAPMSSNFRHQTVLISGAAGGIGSEIARHFAACGARLAIVDRRQPQSDLVEELRRCGAEAVLPLQCDVAEEPQVEAAYRNASLELGAPRALINVAGQMIYKPIESLTQADWGATLAANLLGAAFFIRQAFQCMPAEGAIVNVASVHAERTTQHVAPYAAAKAALVSLTRSAALEGKPKRIRVNAVLPGAVDTEMLRESPNVKSGLEVLDPEDIGQPHEIAPAVLFLASSAASFITGAGLVVDGGRLARL